MSVNSKYYLSCTCSIWAIVFFVMVQKINMIKEWFWHSHKQFKVYCISVDLIYVNIQKCILYICTYFLGLVIVCRSYTIVICIVFLTASEECSRFSMLLYFNRPFYMFSKISENFYSKSGYRLSLLVVCLKF